MSRLEDIKKQMAKLREEADKIANQKTGKESDDMAMKKAMVLKRLRNSNKKDK